MFNNVDKNVPKKIKSKLTKIEKKKVIIHYFLKQMKKKQKSKKCKYYINILLKKFFKRRLFNCYWRRNYWRCITGFAASLFKRGIKFCKYSNNIFISS